MADVMLFLIKLEDRGGLASAGFVLDNSCPIHHLDAVLVEEDEFAAVYGQFCVGTATELTRRNLWMFGWPHRFTRVLCPEQEQATIDEFRRHAENYDDLAQNLDLEPRAKELKERSTMQLTCVKQLRRALQETGFRSHEDIKTLLRTRNRCCAQTQIVEDINGTMKNAKRRRIGTQVFFFLFSHPPPTPKGRECNMHGGPKLRGKQLARLAV